MPRVRQRLYISNLDATTDEQFRYDLRRGLDSWAATRLHFSTRYAAQV